MGFRMEQKSKTLSDIERQICSLSNITSLRRMYCDEIIMQFNWEVLHCLMSTDLKFVDKTSSDYLNGMAKLWFSTSRNLAKT